MPASASIRDQSRGPRDCTQSIISREQVAQTDNTIFVEVHDRVHGIQPTQQRPHIVHAYSAIVVEVRVASVAIAVVIVIGLSGVGRLDAIILDIGVPIGIRIGIRFGIGIDIVEDAIKPVDDIEQILLVCPLSPAYPKALWHWRGP